MHAQTRAYRKLARRALLLTPQPQRDAQLLAPVLHELVVLEVARQPDVPEDGLLELEARLVEVPVHVHRRDLRLEVAVFALQPVHVLLVLLHHLDQAEDVHRLERRLHAGFHDRVVRDVKCAHLGHYDRRVLQHTIHKKKAS